MLSSIYHRFSLNEAAQAFATEGSRQGALRFLAEMSITK
jgi:hypothetical protein